MVPKTVIFYQLTLPLTRHNRNNSLNSKWWRWLWKGNIVDRKFYQAFQCIHFDQYLLSSSMSRQKAESDVKTPGQNLQFTKYPWKSRPQTSAITRVLTFLRRQHQKAPARCIFTLETLTILHHKLLYQLADLTAPLWVSVWLSLLIDKQQREFRQTMTNRDKPKPLTLRGQRGRRRRTSRAVWIPLQPLRPVTHIPLWPSVSQLFPFFFPMNAEQQQPSPLLEAEPNQGIRGTRGAVTRRRATCRCCPHCFDSARSGVLFHCVLKHLE